ncbi:MAG: MmgE/PrpD family protein [Chloroflexota bacterium]|nr:MmgE/PrpD family protein [Chloroflexota bacterium]
MAAKTYVEELAEFVDERKYSDLSDDAVAAMKLRVLDSIGCCLAALDGNPIQQVKAQVEQFGGRGPCTLIGGGQTAPDRAAFYNGALLRYVDFMDNYMGKKQSCHPSDNFASVLAASEFADCSGKEFLTSLALAYAVEIKLIDLIPVEEKGFDHTVHLAYSMTAGVSRALGSTKEETANALGMAGTIFQGLVTSRSGYLSQLKGLASCILAQGVMNTAFLGMRGVTGPLQVLEGKRGLMEALGLKAKIEWDKEDMNAVLRTSVKGYNAEVHSQSTIEGVLELKKEHPFAAEDVEKIDIEIFKQAFTIIGEGEEAGDKHDVHSKEQADHSLPYIVAVAILDGEVTPRQYTPERIIREDVQDLLKKVRVGTKANIGKHAFNVLDTYTARYPDEMPCKITVHLAHGQELECEKSDYEGFFARPMPREKVVSKFQRISEPHADAALLREIEKAVDSLESIQVKDLTALLARVRAGGQPSEG